jgi:hypothetical protein
VTLDTSLGSALLREATFVATPETIEKFHGIAKKVASRNNAEPSDVSNVPDPEFYGWFGQKLSAFTVRKMT